MGARRQGAGWRFLPGNGKRRVLCQTSQSRLIQRSRKRPPSGDSQNDDSNVVIIPPEAVQKAAEEGRPLTLTIQALTAHSGPLPSPAVLREYDAVYPGLSKIIVDQFQTESSHRRRLQSVG